MASQRQIYNGLNWGYEPNYHQIEFDVRLYLTQLDLGGERLWA